MRQDNADFRLTERSYKLGLASEERMRKMEEKKEKSSDFVNFLKNKSVSHEDANPILEANNSSPMKQSDKIFKIFSRPNITMDDVRNFPGVEEYIQENNLNTEILEQTEIQVKYSGYIEKEKNNADT